MNLAAAGAWTHPDLRVVGAGAKRHGPPVVDMVRAGLLEGVGAGTVEGTLLPVANTTGKATVPNPPYQQNLSPPIQRWALPFTNIYLG